MVYRDGTGQREVAPADDTGIVSELIAQFADPYAFLRELVQNAIDAGTTSVAVTVSWEPASGGDASAGPTPGMAILSVRDDGEGMDRDVIEEQLLVLFRSGKEGQEDKIGKFGVGFVSVFATQPELVVVQTSRGEGVGYALHLSPDQSYDLFELPGGASSGTTVTLRVPTPRERMVELTQRCVGALETWCRHASVPIRLGARFAGDDTPIFEGRIDRPLGLDHALVSVERTSADGRTRVVVGLNPRAQPYAGFFNSGLLLHEVDEALAGHVAFKVQDSRLEHTLSRDNVRRDDAFRAALSVVQQAVGTALVPAVVMELAAAAQVRPRARHRALLEAVALCDLRLSPKQQVVPLLAPIDGADVTDGALLAKGGYVARVRSPLVEAAARAGIAVVDVSGLDDEQTAELIGLCGLVANRRLRDVHDELTLLTYVGATPSDDMMLRSMAAHLDRAHRAPRSVFLAELFGANDDRLALPAVSPPEARQSGSAANGDRILAAKERAMDPFALLTRTHLALSASHPLVVAARRSADLDPELAGALLARATLLEMGKLDDKRDARITTDALTLLRGGEP